MFKKIIIIVIVFLFKTQISAQEKQGDNTNNFMIGVNVGPNYNSVRGDVFADRNDASFGYLLGLSFEYSFNENLSVLTNLNYENKSYKAEYESYSQVWTNTFQIKEKTKFKGLNIPILVKYKFGFEREFFINGGIFYNHVFDISNEMINSETGENVSDLDFNELFLDKDYGLSLGIGMTFKLNMRNQLTIEIRDDFGVSDIGDTELGWFSKTSTNSIKFIINWSLLL